MKQTFKLFDELNEYRVQGYQDYGIESKPLNASFNDTADVVCQLLVTPIEKFVFCALTAPQAIFDMLSAIMGFNDPADGTPFYQASRSFIGIFYFVYHAFVDPLWELLVFATRCWVSLFPEVALKSASMNQMEDVLSSMPRGSDQPLVNFI